MLPKIYRIKKKKEFDRIFKKTKSQKQGLLVLRALKNGLDISRFGFIVSQKVSKKAAIRNKIKRRLNEIIRLNLKAIKKGQDYIFLALPGIEKKDFSEIKDAVIKLLKKINV